MRHTLHLSLEQLDYIHRATLQVLETSGIDFRYPPASELMKKKGFKVNGTKVYINETQLMDAVVQTPDRYTLKSLTSDQSVSIGQDDYIITSTSGGTFVFDLEGHRRDATLADYVSFLRLNHTSDVLQVVSPIIVQPSDLSPDTAHIHMMIQALCSTDKPCLALAADPREAEASLKLLSWCAGSRGKLESDYYTTFNINVLSPLGYAPDQVEALMMVAQANQPMTITNMAMAGSTAPIRIEDAIIMGNAEILAGLTLVQAIQPGLPVIYGSTSCAMDMKNMISTLGSPETLQIQRSVIDLARYYHLVCRTGGSLTDSHLPDGRAMSESTLTLENAICHGAHFIMHGCGVMSSYLGTGFEKWIMDEENCRILVHSLKPLDFTASGTDTIINLGSEGGYLVHPETYRLCRSHYRSPWKESHTHDKWLASGSAPVTLDAAAAFKQRIGTYERPGFGNALEKELLHLMGVNPPVTQ
ncbi:MAG: hypothetical protein D3926_16810 [Desulfobacteraceae bacterium]|nr:MAG: hypothetical protein D3926_16810 [Desulfobacteraceae bacterium]